MRESRAAPPSTAPAMTPFDTRCDADVCGAPIDTGVSDVVMTGDPTVESLVLFAEVRGGGGPDGTLEAVALAVLVVMEPDVRWEVEVRKAVVVCVVVDSVVDLVGLVGSSEGDVVFE